MIRTAMLFTQSAKNARKKVRKKYSEKKNLKISYCIPVKYYYREGFEVGFSYDEDNEHIS